MDSGWHPDNNNTQGSEIKLGAGAPLYVLPTWCCKDDLIRVHSGASPQ